MLKVIIPCLFFALAAFCLPSRLGNSDNAKRICGISPALEKYGSHNTDKILEGNVSRPGDWPWMVSLYSHEYFMCSSTLISDEWILTAAHCVFGEDVTDYQARAGSNKRYDGQEHFDGLELAVKKLIYHPLFNPGQNINFHDIALIQISKVTFSDTVKPICLSSKLKHSRKNNTIGVGWGTTWNGSEIVDSYVLREDYIPIDSWKHCTEIDAVTGEDKKTEICVGKGMHAAWHGDSGGPLMKVAHKRFYEVGITSRGLHNDTEITDHSDFEEIYTFVPAYCDWIKETTNGDVKCE